MLPALFPQVYATMGSSQSTPSGTPNPSGMGARWSQVANLSSSAGNTLEAVGNAVAGTGRGVTAFGKAMDNWQQGTWNPDGMKKTGGCPCEEGTYFGGNDEEMKNASKELKEYESSLSAKAKEDVLRRLARALKTAGVPVNPDDDLDTIVQALRKNLPDPRRNTFKADAESQKKACEVVARALNDEFTPGAPAAGRLIDVSLGPEHVCRSVGEWAHSFAAGVNTEFLAVHASVRTAFQNIQALDGVMERLHDEAQSKLRSELDRPGAEAQELRALDEYYRRAQAERRRQEEVLKNLLNVQLAPIAEELRVALNDASEQSALVQKVFGSKIGSRQFADSLAASIGSLGAAASVANRVHRALKAAGLTVRQYLDSPSYRDFQALVDAKVESGTLKAEEAVRLFEAAETLKGNFDRRTDERFRAALEEEGSREKTGGDAEERTKLEKRYDRQKAEKKVLVREFVSRMSRKYADLLAAVKALGPELGRSIPLTDHTDALRDALQRLNDLRRQNERIELALVGMYMDADARERKERFINTLRVVESVCSEIMSLEMYRASSAMFARLRAAIEAIQKTIDYFADTILQKFGAGDDEDEAPVVGGDIEELPEIARSSLSLNEAVNEFKYFYYVAHVRTNLDQTSRELETYGEKYDDALGAAVAARLYTLEQERKAKMDRLAGRPKEFTDNDAGSAAWAAAKTWVKDEYDVKVKFYRALQAMDLYMKAFTLALAKNPDAVSKLKQILDGVQVIARWFNDQTGDGIWQAFEAMGSTNFTGLKVAPVVLSGDGHYYQRIASTISDRDVGIPEIGVPAGATQNDRAADAKTAVRSTYDNFQALKNLVNTFARVGSEFGGRDLNQQVFMAPSQIYKALMDYLRQSALSINAGTKNDNPTDIPMEKLEINGREIVSKVPNAIRPYEVFFGTVRPRIAPNQVDTTGNYVVEDNYFAIIIKAMAAKVLTVVGVFNLFERDTPAASQASTRMIIGGGMDDAPEVNPESSELYFRLPRLVEFYRDLLWSGANSVTDRKIAMLPDLDGTFAGIIRLVFGRLTQEVTESGDYSDLELRAIVREVNAIHAAFREREKASPRDIAMALVAEVNRRYGVVKKADITAYKNLTRSERAAREGYTTVNNTNYAILPGEDEDLDAERKAPSDRFAMAGPAGALSEFVDNSGLGEPENPNGFRMMLRSFRTTLEKKFTRADGQTPLGGTSYSLLFKQAESEIRAAASWDAKFAVVSRLIQGTSTVGVSSDKALMFHETVVTGLNLLGGIKVALDEFAKQMEMLDPVRLENEVMDAMIALRGKFATSTSATATGTHPLLQQLADAMKNSGNDRKYLTTNFAGRVGANESLTNTVIDQIMAAINVSLTERNEKTQMMKGFARLLVNYDRIMHDYVNNLFAMASLGNSFVEVRISRGGSSEVQLSFSRLKDAIETMMSNVKDFFERLRPFLPADTIKRYESSDNVGSIFWMEKHLVDEYVRAPQDDDRYTKSLDRLGRAASQVYRNLTRETEVSLLARDAEGSPEGDWPAFLAKSPTNVTRHEEFGDAFATLAFYGKSTTVNLVNRSANFTLGALIRPERAIGTKPGAVPNFESGFENIQRYAIYDTRSVDSMQPERSLLFSYNQLVAWYLSSLSDTTGGGKIYAGLVRSFANGVASRSVAMPAGGAFPDLANISSDPATEKFQWRGDPKAGAVLAQSLAWVLQRLVRDANPTTQISEHLVDTLTDIPLFIKESMRVNIPVLQNLFNALAQKCELIKQLVQNTSVNLGRASQWAAAGKAAVPGSKFDVPERANNYLPGSMAALHDLSGALDSVAMKERVLNVVDSIANDTYALSSLAAEVYKELQDNPVFFQTDEGSIRTYQSRYGKLPLMPLSLSLWFLRDQAREPNAPLTDSRLFPRYALGEPEFKILYGHRQLLTQRTPVGYEQIPGAKALLDSYNSSAGRGRIEDDRFLKFGQTAVATLRFLCDVRNTRPLLCSDSQNLFSAATLVGSGKPLQPENLVFAMRATSPQAILDIVENTNQDDSVSKITASLGQTRATGQSGRQEEWVANLVDLNVVPINVHALMRQIPLANLYNYEYTFEQMAALMYGQSPSLFTDPENKLTDDKTTTTRQMLLRLLVNPYMEVSDANYGSDAFVTSTEGFIHRIFRGDNDLGMGRPKLLSDQLFGKALFGSVYLHEADYDEAGPGVGIGIGRGRDGRAATLTWIRGNQNKTLTYMNTEGSAVQSVVLPSSETRQRLEAVGRMRFDTRFVRNIFFITNVVRVLRLKLERELSDGRGVLAASHQAVTPGVTEYGADPFGPNEVLGSKRLDHQTRFADE